MRGAASLIPAQLQMLDLQAAVNTRVLLWSLTLAIGTGLLVGVLPAVQATRTDPHESLKADGRAGTARGGSRLRSVLVVAQIALCVVLLMGAGLFMRTFVNIQRVDVGFEPRDVLTMRLTLPRERYPGDAAGAFFDNLVQRLGSLPDVRSVAAASQFPPMGVFDTQFSLDQATGPATGFPARSSPSPHPPTSRPCACRSAAGRTSAPADTLTSPLVAIVNQSFVDRYLPGKDPLGQRMAIGSPQRPRPVDDDRRRSSPTTGTVAPTSQVRPEIFMPVRQQTAWNQLLCWSSGDADAATFLPSVRADGSIARSGAANLFRSSRSKMPWRSRRSQQRIAADAAGDLRGRRADPGSRRHLWRPVVHRRARTQEIGVRIAVGAEPRHVRWLVVGQVLRLAAIGLAVGSAMLARGRPGGGRAAVRDHPS